MNIDKQYDSHAYYEAVDEIKRLSAENERLKKIVGLFSDAYKEAQKQTEEFIKARVSTEQTDVSPNTAIEARDEKGRTPERE